MANTPATITNANFGSARKAANLLMRGDIALAFGLVLILMFMIVPMPSWMIDVGISLSITCSVFILMLVLFIQKPLEFSTFPTVLLIVTALRLGLNIASTRLILANGHTGHSAAGHVIEAFGTFIIQDSYVVGGIVFAILVIVNFVVITKGSGRIAEVAARFSLDAMPGKQMAIDSDLSAGLINEDEAKKRRSELQQESTFFGAMDGAAKFVRGDAIAGLLITFINIIGGIIIGTMAHDLDLQEAGSTYTILTIGEGLVAQIPALIVSVAAGLLVSKAGVEGTADAALVEQFTRYPKPMALSAGLLLAMAAIPGIPPGPFVVLAGVMGFMAYTTFKKQDAEKARVAEMAQLEQAQAKPAEEPISKALSMDTVRLELGYALLPMVQGINGGNKLTEQIKGLRRQLAEEMGFILPAVRIQDNLQLSANTYVLRIKEVEAGRGEVRPGMLLCMDPAGQPINLPGENTVEPTFGLPAMWIDERYREEAHFKGYTVVDATTVMSTHLTEVVKDNMADLLSYTETQKLLDELGPEYQKLVSDVVPTQITVSGLQRLLQNLVSERVSIRDLPTILEGVSEATTFTKNISFITEHVRTRLARQLCDQHVNLHGVVPLLTMSAKWEQAFAEALRGDGEEKQLAMPPSQLQEFIVSIRQAFDKFMQQGESPVLLTSPAIRPYVRSVVERFRPHTIVMSQNEIHPRAKIKTLGQI
ncbi:MAG: flagellar biosynthesis protein FlhA [Alphaproteobacteria bacterium]|nr:flagellar biosynthesis protein FlhA [Alphaproteobacteria bacterium]